MDSKLKSYLDFVRPFGRGEMGYRRAVERSEVGDHGDGGGWRVRVRALDATSEHFIVTA
jgi:hypothetical protein